ncbi:aromatic hydrocarbon degradation protein [Skermanella aerolata]|uniref:Aromatic hydrocarbon degradation protein n=1 Tax=Skermanella aerolata TaxID=393310 RepID=A0A512DLL8_9PROT|nr:outer membrane protein transport protein [Skermanella aerolata]KJB96229.1 long-chain fatty acid transporter [Skermanella aerolata KACC 11604]GEO37355.1 aromatic hydrocarbon degradation protein [Skermanella aerolata]
MKRFGDVSRPLAASASPFASRLAVTSVLALLAGAQPASAAGFYIKEQSVTGLGRAFAGESAMAEDASTIFFNPAGMTRLQGPEATAGAHLLVPRADLENRGSSASVRTPAGAVTRPIGGSDGGNPYDPTPVPNAYFAYPLMDRDLWVGLGVSAPFGLANKYNADWFGRYDSIETDLLTIDIAPSVAYKVLDWVSIGGGIDIQYADAKLTNAIFAGTGPDIISNVEGDDWAVGYNVGILFEPLPTTRVGIHYRSKIDHTLEGDVKLNRAGTSLSNLPGSADLDLPDIIAVGFAHDVTPALTVMAEYNWYGWSSFKEIRVKRSGLADQVVTQNYQDTFSVALGAQYKVDDAWTVRGGFQYDETPTVDGFRSTRTPDGDRYWLSAGLSYDVSDSFTVDVAYTHVFIDDADVNTSQTGAAAALSTNTRAMSEGSVDIFAAALRYKF